MTTKISEVIACIEQMAPLAYQESWDNSGVQVGDVSQEVRAVLLCVYASFLLPKEGLVFWRNGQ